MWVVFGGGRGAVVDGVDGRGDREDREDVEGFLACLAVFGGGCLGFSFSCSPISVSVRRSRIVFIL